MPRKFRGLRQLSVMATAVSAQREQPCLERVSAKRECAAVSVQREQPCLLYAMGGGSASAKREQSVHSTGIQISVMATAVSAQREQPCLECVSAKRECTARL